MGNYAENKKYHFTYKTINLINGRYYLGMHSTNTLNDRYLGSGKRLYYEIKKYGKSNFKLEIIKQYDSREALIKGEIDLITKEDLSNPNCLNLMFGGKGGIVDEAHHHKMRLGASIKNSKQMKDFWSNEENSKTRSINISEAIKNASRDKLDSMLNGSKWWKGKKHKIETIDKIKESKRGRGFGSQNSQYDTCWITNERQNKKLKRNTPIPKGWRLGRVMKSKN